MRGCRCILRLFAAVLTLASSQNAATSSALGYYTAAVFQNAIRGDPNSTEGLDPACTGQGGRTESCHGRAIQHANLVKYDRAMGAAKAQEADIIVFNEAGIDADLWSGSLTGKGKGEQWQALACEPIPESGDQIPCDATDWENFPVTRNASCLARKHQMVMVIHTCDRQPCRSGQRTCTHGSDVDCCPASGYELFNAQVAFSERGALLAKYHKTNNYDRAPDAGETSLGLCCWPPRENLVYFDTSFGVRFGMHICFDIMFRSPGVKLALDSDLNIRDFVYSTHWETTGPPMLPAVEIQQGWSRGIHVNLLAANAGLGYAHAGSGIYSAGEALAVHYNPSASRDDRLLVARVPKLPKDVKANMMQPRSSQRHNISAPPIPAASIQTFDVNLGTRQTITTSSNGFTCRATLLSTNQTVPEDDRYLLMAVNGSWFGGVLPSRSCVLLRCGSLPEHICVERVSCWDYKVKACAGGRSLYNSAADLSANTVFDSVELEGSFDDGDVVLPIVGAGMGQLVDSKAIQLDGGRMLATLGKPLLNAMLFAIPQERTPVAEDGVLAV